MKKDPSRDLPIGIVGSLLVSTVLYVFVSAALTLMVNYEQLDENAPLSRAFLDVRVRGQSMMRTMQTIMI